MGCHGSARIRGRDPLPSPHAGGSKRRRHVPHRRRHRWNRYDHRDGRELLQCRVKLDRRQCRRPVCDLCGGPLAPTQGASATAAIVLPFVDELLRCQRLYENSNGSGGTPDYNNDGYAVTSIGAFGSYQFKAGKRVTPTIGATFQSGSGAAFTPAGKGSFYQSNAHSGPALFQWTADADL